MKDIDHKHYFPVELFVYKLYKVALIFESVDTILN